MEALKACGVSKRYGERKVLDGFSLALEAGSVHALMGPSGSGKSTFLHLAAGLLPADGGEILVGGRDVAKMGDSEAAVFRRRHVGVVFQSFNLIETKTVRENAFLPLALESRKAARDAAAAARLASLAARLGIEGILDRLPGEISGGERQRAAILRALLAEPEIVLADEPTGNLDAKASKEICSILSGLGKAGKSAILVVTHDPQVAASAGTVHFLKDGSIAASCATEGDPALVSRLYLETYR